MKTRLLALFLAAAPLIVAADTPVLIQNATILTVTNGTVKGSILLRDGKIAALGEKVLAPPGATVVDGAQGVLVFHDLAVQIHECHGTPPARVRSLRLEVRS